MTQSCSNGYGCSPMHESRNGCWRGIILNEVEYLLRLPLHLRTCAARHFLAKFGPSTATAEHSWTDPPPSAILSLAAARDALQKCAIHSAPSSDPRVTEDASSHQRIVLISTYRWRRCVSHYTFSSAGPNAVGQSFILTRVFSR